MLVPDQKITIQWNRATKKYYESKGYIFTAYGDSFVVSVDDLRDGSSIPVSVTCDYCGKECSIPWYKYLKLNRQNKKNACYGCVQLKIHEEDLQQRQDKLYAKALCACQEKGYTLLSHKSEIKNNISYVLYLCPIHGINKMRVSNLINGKGCPDCAHDTARQRYQLSFDEVEKRVIDCGGSLLNKYDYVNQTTKNLQIECFECGHMFLTSLRNFTQHGGQVCSNCKNNESSGEKKIRHYLEDNNVVFIQQHWFKDCRDKNPLPFDFYLPAHNVIVEFDGRQHFEDTDYFSYSYEQTKHHDDIKNTYCDTHGIKLIRIPHWKINKIEQILDKELISHEDIV